MKTKLTLLLALLFHAVMPVSMQGQTMLNVSQRQLRASGLTIGNLPGTPVPGELQIITDGADTSDCTTGSGSSISVCRYNGSAWASTSLDLAGTYAFTALGATVSTVSMEAPFFVSGAADPADAEAVRLGNTECLAWEAATPGTDLTLCVDSSDDLNFSSAGRFTDLGIGIAPTTDLHVYVDDTRGGTSGDIRMEQDGLGDAVIEWVLTGARAWIMGVDNDDSDTFKIQPAASATWANSVFEIDTSGNMHVVGSVGVGIAPTSNLHVYEDTTSTTPALRVENDGTGDAAAVFVATGVNGWSLGIDNDDGDAFKISASSSGVSTSTRLRMPVGGGVQHIDAGTKPTCNAALRGTSWYDAGAAGVADTYEVCGKDAGDAYAWKTAVTF